VVISVKVLNERRRTVIVVPLSSFAEGQSADPDPDLL